MQSLALRLPFLLSLYTPLHFIVHGKQMTVGASHNIIVTKVRRVQQGEVQSNDTYMGRSVRQNSLLTKTARKHRDNE